jgi:hypothetical protein
MDRRWDTEKVSHNQKTSQRGVRDGHGKRAVESTGKRAREGDPKGWSTVLVTALCSVLRKPVPRGHSMLHSPS